MKNIPGSLLKKVVNPGTYSLTITIKSLITTTAVTAAKKNYKSDERKQCNCTFVDILI